MVLQGNNKHSTCHKQTTTQTTITISHDTATLTRTYIIVDSNNKKVTRLYRLLQRIKHTYIKHMCMKRTCIKHKFRY